ncbi:hypothetical protein MTsN2n4_12260 [Pseudoalteromonas sp. MTN2-4]
MCLSMSTQASEQSFYLSLNKASVVQPITTGECAPLPSNENLSAQTHLRTLQEWQRYCVYIPVELNDNAPLGTRLDLIFLGSAKVYWDGEWLANKGLPGHNRLQEQVGPISRSLLLSPEQISAGLHWLTLDLSTQHHESDFHTLFYRASLSNNQLGLKTNHIVPLMLIGAMILLATCFAFLFFRYQRALSYLAFSCLCLMSAFIIALELIKFYWSYPWNLHLWRLRIILVSVILAGVCLVSFYASFFQSKYLKYWLAGTLALNLLTVLTVKSFDMSNYVVFISSLLNSALISLLALKKQAQAKAHLLMLASGIAAMFLIPMSFIDTWFAALFSVIALVNLYALIGHFNLQRQAALKKSQLEAELLRRNLQPHFLMNSLTLICEWIETSPKQAIELVEQLSEEFRILNKMSAQTWGSLEDEIALCQMHFSIMQKRQQKALSLTIDVPSSSYYLPPAIIHTVIENAFSHNRIKAGDSFAITASEQNNRLKLCVKTPYRQRKHQGQGTGSAYIHSRLQQCFDDDYEFESVQKDTIWLSTFLIPLQKQIPA